MDLLEGKPDPSGESEMMDGAAALADGTLSLDKEALDRLARLSDAWRRTPQQTVDDALLALEQLRDEEQAELHIWTEEDDAVMRQAIAEFEMGEGVPHEQVMAEARAIIGA